MRPQSIILVPTLLVNMSLWQDIESLHNYVYRSAHNEVLAQRKLWFERMIEALFGLMVDSPAATFRLSSKPVNAWINLREYGDRPPGHSLSKKFSPPQ